MIIPVINSFKFSHQGMMFLANVLSDEFAGTPWEGDRADFHGLVSEWTQRERVCGERVLWRDDGFRRLYDHRASVQRFMKDCVCTRDRAHEIAREDFKRLKAWCNGEWEYCGLEVSLLDDFNDEINGFEQTLWGLESDNGEYLRVVASDLAEEMIAKASCFETAAGGV